MTNRPLGTKSWLIRVSAGAAIHVVAAPPRRRSGRTTRAGTDAPGSPRRQTRSGRPLGSARALGSDVALRFQVQNDLLGRLLGRELGRVDGDVGVAGHLV